MPFRGYLFSRFRGFARDQYFATRRGWRRALPRSAPPRNAFVHCLVDAARSEIAPHPAPHLPETPSFIVSFDAARSEIAPHLAPRHAATQGAPDNRRGLPGVSCEAVAEQGRLRPTSLRMSLPRGLRGTHHTMDDASRSLHQGRDLRARRFRARRVPATARARSPSAPPSGAPRAFCGAAAATTGLCMLGRIDRYRTGKRVGLRLRLRL